MHWPASQPTQRALGKKFCLKNKVDSTSGGMTPKVSPPPPTMVAAQFDFL